ncbi:hypothetical protein I6A84_15030 [Frankia sp. CNm7]|uniref:Uncharacterized protein n=1 Tax=Frankia nepalensis TaxID=1836974 RepID=A0A937RPH2_9ACTN|nr:hypothetical protein [Frankia nepalensis]MBL7497706.1 hypothetical protein [Frankia nepalensis]MBL7514292.1 hypothetical protein [Frankia nepalensis]MBL7519381.1 hypothetical protein [Frankia nepalensis]MBL7630248.1 hypothetical protein [Frankia nepalensis]
MDVRIVIDGQAFALPAGTDPGELRRRVAQAVFRCEVEQLHLADGSTMLVNWRSVRTIRIEPAGPARHAADGTPLAAPPPGTRPPLNTGTPGTRPPLDAGPSLETEPSLGAEADGGRPSGALPPGEPEAP